MHINIREEDKKQVAFAWVDGDFWDRWLRTSYGVDVRDGERVIICDEDVSDIPFFIKKTS
jgi:protein disulfide-isomerase